MWLEDLVEELKKEGHAEGAAYWAIDDCLQRGWLRLAWVERTGGMPGELPVNRKGNYVHPTEELWANWLREQQVTQLLSQLSSETGQKPPPPVPPVGEDHPDGPEGGCWLWWQGRRHDIPKGVVYRLIDYMWGRDYANYDDLDGPVFEEGFLPGTLRGRVSEANKVLERIRIPWILETNATNRFLTKKLHPIN